jgi:putative DNA primase/helicase
MSMPATAADQATRFFRSLFGDHVETEAQIAIWTMPDKRTRFFDNINDAVTYATSRSTDSEVYFGVGLYRNGITTGRGKADDVIAISCLWADIDFGDSHGSGKKYAPNRAEADRILDAISLAPTGVIDSGHGYHVYWVLDEPIAAGDGAADRAKYWSDGVQAAARCLGYEVDAVGDLARVLRVPGTYNRKRDPLAVTIVRINEEATYTRGDTDAASELLLGTNPKSKSSSPPTAATTVSVDAEVVLPQHKFDTLITNNPKFEKTWNRKRSDLKDQSASGYDLSVAKQAILAGWSDNEVASLVFAWRAKHYEDTDKLRRKDYLTKLLALARSDTTEANDDNEKTSDGKGLTRTIADAIQAKNHFAQDIGRGLFLFKDGVYVADGEEAVRRLVKTLLLEWNKSVSWSRNRASEVVEFIRVDAPTLWDRPPRDTLNVRNGLLDVKTRILNPHSPTFLSPVQVPVVYDAKAKCPAWEQFVSEVFPEDAQQLAWEIPAWLMLPGTSIQKAILLVGEGANGKSVYLRNVQSFLGTSNVANLSLQQIETNRFASERLVGKLANICADLPSTDLASTAVFKAIVGGDRLPAERKHRTSFIFTPFCRLVFSANDLPRSSDSSDGFFRRWIVVPFPNRFDGKDAIPGHILDKKLTSESELSGLLNMALAVLPQLHQDGFSEPLSTRAAFEEFRHVTDPIAVWLDTHTQAGGDMWVPKNELLAAYNATCDREARPRITAKSFTSRIRALRSNLEGRQKQVHGIRAWVWVGIGLKNHASQPDPPLICSDAQGAQDHTYLRDCREHNKEEEKRGGSGSKDNPVHDVHSVSSVQSETSHEFDSVIPELANLPLVRDGWKPPDAADRYEQLAEACAEANPEQARQHREDAATIRKALGDAR